VFQAIVHIPTTTAPTSGATVTFGKRWPPWFHVSSGQVRGISERLLVLAGLSEIAGLLAETFDPVRKQ
jgi:hypothetical protein